MPAPLATNLDVTDLWRPLSDVEVVRVDRLCAKASALLRQAAPWVDARIARFAANPADLGGVSPESVATAVATMVKHFLVNPDGATNMSETTGPYSQSRGYALRGDKDPRGALAVTEAILDMIAPPVLSRARLRVLGVNVSAGLSPDDLDLSNDLLPVEGSVFAGNGWIGGAPW